LRGPALATNATARAETRAFFFPNHIPLQHRPDDSPSRHRPYVR
jgi:hypothetical protein